MERGLEEGEEGWGGPLIWKVWCEWRTSGSPRSGILPHMQHGKVIHPHFPFFYLLPPPASPVPYLNLPSHQHKATFHPPHLMFTSLPPSWFPDCSVELLICHTEWSAANSCFFISLWKYCEFPHVWYLFLFSLFFHPALNCRGIKQHTKPEGRNTEVQTDWAWLASCSLWTSGSTRSDHVNPCFQPLLWSHWLFSVCYYVFVDHFSRF